MERLIALSKTLTSLSRLTGLLKQKTTFVGLIALAGLWGFDLDQVLNQVDGAVRIVTSLGALGFVLWDEDAKAPADVG